MGRLLDALKRVEAQGTDSVQIERAAAVEQADSPAEEPRNVEVVPLADSGFFASTDEFRIEESHNLKVGATGEEATSASDAGTAAKVSSVPDLIDDLKATIQRELTSESASENEESRPLPVEAGTNNPAADNTLGGAIDEFRQLARNIAAQWADDEAASLLIASAEPAGEVTSVVAQLAIALAAEEMGSILVVGVGRTAEAAQCLEAAPRPPWADVLTGKRDWRDQIRPTATPGLDSLAAPIESALTVERGPARLGAVLSELCCHYRLVLVDGSGVDPAHLGPLARGCAGVYLVVRLQETTQRVVKSTLRRLKAADARIMGCIATGAMR